MGFPTLSFTREANGLLLTGLFYMLAATIPLSPLILLGIPFLPLIYNIYGLDGAIHGEIAWVHLFLLFPALFLTIPLCFLAIPVGVFLLNLSIWYLPTLIFSILVANIPTSITWIVYAAGGL